MVVSHTPRERAVGQEVLLCLREVIVYLQNLNVYTLLCQCDHAAIQLVVFIWGTFVPAYVGPLGCSA